MTPWIERCAGVLLHATSLPGGRLGADAARFAGLLAACGARIWQLLPIGVPDRHGSPYQPESAFAGHAALFADADEMPDAAAHARFVEESRDWLPDYALFAALAQRFDGAEWHAWPAPLRDREAAALAQARRELAGAIGRIERAQSAFEHRWQAFKRRANDGGLLIFGDVPLFMAHHSADVWAQRELFEIGPEGQCLAFMGVPPDAFTQDGQWWGYPPYRWDAMAAEDYRWWRRRFEVQSRRFDLVRIDHFRGLAAFWRIPRGAASAREGAWSPGPGRASIDVLQPVLRGTRLVAEDLGDITPDVIRMRHDLGLPGMRVLQFAFDGDPQNLHLPHRHDPDTVCYTGTHDNDTTLGWWNALDEPARQRVADALQRPAPVLPDDLVECAWRSPAPLAIVPMQDLLGLGSEARMNRPGVMDGNWGWRFDWRQLPDDFAARLREDFDRHGRRRVA